MSLTPCKALSWFGCSHLGFCRSQPGCLLHLRSLFPGLDVVTLDSAGSQDGCLLHPVRLCPGLDVVTLNSAGLSPDVSYTPEAFLQHRVERPWLLPVYPQNHVPSQKPFPSLGCNILGFCRSTPKITFHPKKPFPSIGWNSHQYCQFDPKITLHPRSLSPI